MKNIFKSSFKKKHWTMKRQSRLNAYTVQSVIMKYCKVETKSTNAGWSVTNFSEIICQKMLNYIAPNAYFLV